MRPELSPHGFETLLLTDLPEFVAKSGTLVQRRAKRLQDFGQETTISA